MKLGLLFRMAESVFNELGNDFPPEPNCSTVNIPKHLQEPGVRGHPGNADTHLERSCFPKAYFLLQVLSK